MKRVLTLIWALVMVCGVITGCAKGDNSSGSGSSDAASSGGGDVESAKTFGDIMDYDELGSSFSEKGFAIGFDAGGTIYQAKGELSGEVADKYWELNFDDPDYNEQRRALIGDVEITELINLTDLIPPQEELDAWVGKTGKELFDAGWVNWGYNLEDMTLYMTHEYFSYIVTMNYDGPQLENSDSFDIEGAVADLTIKSVEYEGIGDPGYIEGQ